MRVLVTGGKGFIGKHLCRALELRGYEAQSYDIKDGQDILDRAKLDAAIKNVDAVFHLAGLLGTEETLGYIERTMDVNIKGTLNVLSVCHDHDKPMINLSVRTGWMNPYLISKRCAAEMVLMYHRHLGLKAVVIKALNVYGPGQHWGRIKKAVPTFIVAAIKGEPLSIYGNGKQIVDLIHVLDICEIMIRSLEQEVWGESIDGCTGVPMRVIDLAEMILGLTNSKSSIEFKPMRKGEPPQSIQAGNPAEALQLLEYYPRIELIAGMADTINWYKKYYLEAEEHA